MSRAAGGERNRRSEEGQARVVWIRSLYKRQLCKEFVPELEMG